LVTEVVGLFPPSLSQVLAVGQQTCSCHADVGIDRLYTLVRAFDEELGVEKALDAEDHSV
jgi:hypothetical protein